METWERHMLAQSQKPRAELYIHVPRKKYFPESEFPVFRQMSADTWAARLTESSMAEYKKIARRWGLDYEVKQEEFTRSNDYRYEFIRANPPKNGYYRCVYCGKKITKDEMQVDHVLPVYAAQTKRSAQRKAKKLGDINHLNNLVASCASCNRKKGASTDPKWTKRAKRGKHESYWIFRKVAITCLIIFALFMARKPIYQLYQVLNPGSTNSFFMQMMKEAEEQSYHEKNEPTQAQVQYYDENAWGEY